MNKYIKKDSQINVSLYNIFSYNILIVYYSILPANALSLGGRFIHLLTDIPDTRK